MKWHFSRQGSEPQDVTVEAEVYLDATLAVREVVCCEMGLSMLPVYMGQLKSAGWVNSASASTMVRHDAHNWHCRVHGLAAVRSLTGWRSFPDRRAQGQPPKRYVRGSGDGGRLHLRGYRCERYGIVLSKGFMLTALYSTS